jgi:hypothetical protein
MYKLCGINLRRRKEIFEKLERYKRELIKKLKPSLILLFGSFARGDINEGSDIDLLVVADFDLNFLDRIKLLIDLNKFGIPIEPLGYTPKEFEQMQKDGNPFISEVLEKGKVLFEVR